MNDVCILIVGVGGQGTLLTSRVIGNAALQINADVKISEVHGMSQRGGSVVTYVKYGDKIHSPLIEEGEADFVLSFEKLEALRFSSYLKKDGMIITSIQQINPSPVILGTEKYTENIVETLTEKFGNVESVDAVGLARKSGSLKSVNMVLLGVLAKHSDISYDIWIKSITETVPKRTIEFNIQAFNEGYHLQN